MRAVKWERTHSIQIIKVNNGKMALWLRVVREENLRPEAKERAEPGHAGAYGLHRCLGCYSKCSEKPGTVF